MNSNILTQSTTPFIDEVLRRMEQNGAKPALFWKGKNIPIPILGASFRNGKYV